MSQTKEAVFSPIEYGRHDLLALKTYLGGGVALSKIAAFYQDGAPQLAYGLEKWLTEMRADLIERAIAVNPAATAGLAMARKGGTISSKTLELIYQLADCRPAPAKNTDLIGQWLMPKSYAVIATHFFFSSKVTTDVWIISFPFILASSIIDSAFSIYGVAVPLALATASSIKASAFST